MIQESWSTKICANHRIRIGQHLFLTKRLPAIASRICACAARLRLSFGLSPSVKRLRSLCGKSCAARTHTDRVIDAISKGRLHTRRSYRPHVPLRDNLCRRYIKTVSLGTGAIFHIPFTICIQIDFSCRQKHKSEINFASYKSRWTTIRAHINMGFARIRGKHNNKRGTDRPLCAEEVFCGD